MITKEIFDRLPEGKIFATGILPNTPAGLFMTNSGGELKWVATKGYADDWAIYCHWSYSSDQYVKDHGDKVIREHHIKLCVPCSNEVFSSYRY